MIVGQLWFGWSRRGVDGVDRQQIIAASGGLDDRAQAVTRLVLTWCYRPERPTFGWAERDGVAIAFRRTPTGRDGHGRPGAFLVHVLVSPPGTLAPDTLARLWSGDVWVRRVPDDPPAKLAALGEVADLKLGDAPVVEEGLVGTALAGHLANLAGGRRSALAVEEGVAVAVAARIAALLPARLGLLSFSTGEDAEHADGYDLVAGAPPSPAFAPIGDDSPGQLWNDAARLLLDAAVGDPSAAGLVEATAEGAVSHAAFALGLHAYAAIDRASEAGGAAATIAPATWAHIVSDPRRLTYVLSNPAVSALAGAIVAGVSEARQALSRLPSSVDRGPLAEELTTATARLSVNEGVRVVEAIAHAPQVAAKVARGLIRTWRADGRIRELGASDIVALLRVQAHGAATRDLDEASESLLGLGSVTKEIVAATDLPVEWRARAVALRPRNVSADTLVGLIARVPGFPQLMLADAGDAAFDAIGAAIAAVPAEQGYEAAQRIGMLAPAQYEHWLWSAVSRLPLADRHRVLGRILAGGRVRGDVWADAMLTAFVELVLAARVGTGPLPALCAEAVLRPATQRADRWRSLRERLYGRSLRARDRAFAAGGEAVRLAERDRDAAFELIVDAIADWRLPHGEWDGALRDAEHRAAEAPEAFVARVVRASTRHGRATRTDLSMWTAIWIADRVEGRIYEEDLLKLPLLDSLVGQPLTKDERKRLNEYAGRYETKAARRWLEAVGRGGSRLRWGR